MELKNRDIENGVEHIIVNKQNLGLAKSFSIGLDACLKAGADIIIITSLSDSGCDCFDNCSHSSRGPHQAASRRHRQCRQPGAARRRHRLSERRRALGRSWDVVWSGGGPPTQSVDRGRSDCIIDRRMETYLLALSSLIVVIGPWKAAIVFAERTSGLPLATRRMVAVATFAMSLPLWRGQYNGARDEARASARMLEFESRETRGRLGVEVAIPETTLNLMGYRLVGEDRHD